MHYNLTELGDMMFVFRHLLSQTASYKTFQSFSPGYLYIYILYGLFVNCYATNVL